MWACGSARRPLRPTMRSMCVISCSDGHESDGVTSADSHSRVSFEASLISPVDTKHLAVL